LKINLHLKKAVLCLLLTSSTSFLLAQTDSTSLKPKRSNLRINFGLAHQRFIDEGLTFSKRAFHSTVPSLYLSYSWGRGNRIWQIGVEGSHGNAQTAEKDITADISTWNLSFNYLLKIKTYRFIGSRTEFWAGAGIGSNGLFTSNRTVLDNMGILLGHGLNLNVVQQMEISSSSHLKFWAEIPFATFTRSVIYDGGALDPHEYSGLNSLFLNTRFSFLNMRNFPQLRVEYTRKIAPLTDLTVQYRFAYVNNQYQHPVRFYGNQLLAGFKFNW
jgi:hypothetical protein